MSASIPTIEPTTVTAGDTLTWKKSLSDYPADSGWSLSYALLGSAGKIAINASASGADHLVSVSATTSAGYAAGVYAWQSYVTHATSGRVMVGSGTIEVLANFAAISTATDTRSHAKTVLDAIEAIIEGRASTGDQELTIDGTRLVKMSVEQLIMLRLRYLREYRSELQAAKIAAGVGAGYGKIRVRL